MRNGRPRIHVLAQPSRLPSPRCIRIVSTYKLRLIILPELHLLIIRGQLLPMLHVLLAPGLVRAAVQTPHWTSDLLLGLQITNARGGSVGVSEPSV